MKTVLCVKRIQQVREIARNPELAYAARTRLYRVILACTRFVARETGLPEPAFPGRYELPEGSSEQLRRICDITNHLLARSRSMCRPSEPLDDRWSEGWHELTSWLDKLEDSVLAARPAGHSTERRRKPAALAIASTRRHTHEE